MMLVRAVAFLASGLDLSAIALLIYSRCRLCFESMAYFRTLLVMPPIQRALVRTLSL